MFRSPRFTSSLGRTVVLALVFIFWDVNLTVLAQPGDSERPRVNVPAPEHDFGSVAQGSLVKHDFVIRNMGKGALRIESIVPSCGCTASSASTDTIAPGAEGLIHVEFDTQGFSGKKLKTVKLHTNDFEEPSVMLTLSGHIEQDVEIVPTRLFFGEVRRGESKSEEVSVIVREQAGFSVGDIKSHSPFFHINFKEQSPKRQRFTVSIDPQARIGEIRSRVVVTLDSKSQRSINIPVFASVKGNIELTPSSVSLGVLQGGEVLRRSVKLENFGSQPLKIKGVSSNDETVKVVLKTIKEGSAYVIEVSVDPREVKKNLRALVTVLTDSAEQQELGLNVYGVLPPTVR